MSPAAAVLTVVLTASGADPDPVFTITDPRITENSGMADLSVGTVVTNDSGDEGRVFLLDGRGGTVGVTRFGDSVDAEALAPAGPAAVWVGDIGDNKAKRPFVVVRRVPVQRGERTVAVPAYQLVYPDGPHDAETLLRDPGSGRLYVVTKATTRGRVYAAPATLDPDAPNRLTRVTRVAAWATDGAVLPDGKRVLIRGYAAATLLTFPGFRPLRAVPLPAQEQGESLSVGPGGRIRIGSEGVGQPVLAVRLSPASPSADPPSSGDSARATRHAEHVGTGEDQTERTVFWSLLGAVLLAAVGMVAAVRRQRR